MKLAARIGVVSLELDAARLAIVKTGGKLPVVLEAHAVPIPETAEDAWFDVAVGAVRSLAGAVRAKPSIYVLAVGSRDSVARALTIPFRGKRRVAAAVKFELEPYLAVPVDLLTVDHLFVREVENESEVLAVGMRTQELAERVAVLTAAGITVEGIGLDAAGLTALWTVQDKPTPGLHALLFVRETDALLVVTFLKTPAFFRTLPIGFELVRDDPGRTAREIQNTVRAFMAKWRGSDELVDITIFGPELPEASREALDGALSMPVRFADPLCGVKGREKFEIVETGVSPVDHAALVGAAMSASGGGPDLNFARGALAAPAGARILARHAALSVVLLAMILTGFLFYTVVTYRQRMAEIDGIGKEIWNTYAELFPTSPTVQNGRHPSDVSGDLTLQTMMDEAQRVSGGRGGMSLDVLTRPTLLALLAEISTALPGDQVTITDIKVRASRDRSQEVVIQGDVSAMAVGAVNALFEKLRTSELLKVTIDTPMTTIKDEQASFTIVAQT